MIKISVIIPVFNSENFIERCLNSVFKQTLKDIEIIIVDDCSNDNTISVIQNCIRTNTGIPVQIIHNERNCGVSTSRNNGLKVAKGEFIYFCDNDDWIAPDMLETMYSSAINNNSDLVMCDFTAEYQNRTEVIEIQYPQNSGKVSALKKYLSSIWNPIWNIIALKSLFIDNNIFFPAGLNMCEDFLVSTQLLYKSKNPLHISRALYYYNRANNSSFLQNIDAKRRQMKIDVNLLTISFFKKEGEYDTYKKELCWRLLNSKQELCFQPETFKQFLEIHPESHKYILSCPYLSLKVKITMWCLTHKLKPIPIIATSLRKLKYHN